MTRAVFSFHRKDPVPGVFNAYAANLVFQKRYAAESFLGRCKGRDGIKIRGRGIYAAWNREMDPCGHQVGRKSALPKGTSFLVAQRRIAINS